MNLCTEIKENIIKFLDGNSIYNMACINKEWNEIISDQRLWKRLIKIYKMESNFYDTRAVYISNLEDRCIQCYKNTYNMCPINKHIVCNECIKSIPMYRVITKTMAKKQYFLNEEKDLKQLRCYKKENPYYSRGPLMTLYLYYDVMKIAYEKYGGRVNFEKIKKQKEEKRMRYYRNRRI